MAPRAVLPLGQLLIAASRRSTSLMNANAARPQRWFESRQTPLVSSSLAETVLRRLGAFAPLSAEDAEAVRAHLVRTRSAAPETQLVAEGSAAAPPSFLVSGWACRARNLPNGRRQIISFVLPGDALVPLLQPEGIQALCATVALIHVEVASAARLQMVLGQMMPQQHHGLRAAFAAAEQAEQGAAKTWGSVFACPGWPARPLS